MSDEYGDLTQYTTALQARGLHPRADDEEGTLRVAPPHAAASTFAVSREIVVDAPISRGGMGEVLSARQLSLGREVAVKRPLAGGDLALVHEARVAGALEHPNVAPVHLLDVDAHGRPLLVMKRIDGTPWSTLMKRERNMMRDVDVLMNVCHALHFAHSRGVVHRDVKPHNVMVGSFGEVYLLDWGIAVAVGDNAPADLPRAAERDDLVGTAAYMAPEMAIPRGVIEPRTDVFLAGAVLYQIIAGKPPWLRRTLEASLFAAHRCELPAFPDDVPEELVAICKRALARGSADRFASADELRLALARFRDHAAARALCDEASARLAQLGDKALTRESRHALFHECRFGFTQALRAWPESERAQSGLRAAIELMATLEIADGFYDGATVLVAELNDAPAELVASLTALGEKRAKETASVDALDRIERDSDVLTADGERAGMLLGVAGGFLLFGGALQFLHAQGTYDAGPSALATGAAVAALSSIVGAIFVPRMRATTAARQATWSMITTPLAAAGVGVVGAAFALSIAAVDAMTMIVLALGFAARLMHDRRVLPALIVAALMTAPIVVWPQWCHVLTGAGICATLVAAAMPAMAKRS